METLNGTQPHYVRCIKPNDTKAPFLMNNIRVIGQLRACGVLETVRITAAGYTVFLYVSPLKLKLYVLFRYPSRWGFSEFVERYKLLASPTKSAADFVALKADPRKASEAILAFVFSDPDKFQIGVTKVFFRAGQVFFCFFGWNNIVVRYD